MRPPILLCAALILATTNCKGRDDTTIRGSSRAVADSPATVAATPARDSSAPVPDDDDEKASKDGKESGTIPATPTPTVTTESSIATMRAHLARLDSASADVLQGKVAEHTKLLGDLLTTMRVEAQASTSPRKEAWIAAADSVEGDLDKLALAHGEQLRTAFRTHRNRVLKLLDDFRALVPKTI